MELEQFPLVSIIITTRNSTATIGECLKSIERQTYPKEKVEIILVDNRSSDDTVAIARSFTTKIFNYGPERSAQRNLGGQKAQGKYILYLDSDMALSKGAIFACIAKCEKENLIALYIPEQIVGKGFWLKVRNFERSFFNATCIDSVRFVLRDKFCKIGGFDETLTGPEDWDFDRRIKEMGEISIIDAPLFHFEGTFSLPRFLQKKRYYAPSLDKYVAKWGKDDKIIRRQLGLGYRYLGVFVEKGKWKKLLRNPLLTLGLYTLRFVLGIDYLLCRYKRRR